MKTIACPLSCTGGFEIYPEKGVTRDKRDRNAHTHTHRHFGMKSSQSLPSRVDGGFVRFADPVGRGFRFPLPHLDQYKGEGVPAVVPKVQQGFSGYNDGKSCSETSHEPGKE